MATTGAFLISKSPLEKILGFIFSRVLFTVLFLVFTHPFSAAEETVVLSDKNEYMIGKQCEFLLDSGRALTVAEISSVTLDPAFTACGEDILNFGYTPSALWLRVTVRDQSDHRRWALKVDNFDDIRVYLPDKSGAYQEYRFGRKTPASNFLRRYGYYFIDLPRFAEETTVYIRYVHEDTMVVHLSIVDIQTILNSNSEELFYGFYFGIIAVMAVYNLLLFFLLKDSSYVYYALYVINMFLIQLVFSGFILDVIPAGSFFSSDMIETTVIALALTLYVQFARKFLITALISPKVDRILFVIAIVSVIHIPTIFFVPYLLRTLSLSILFITIFVLNGIAAAQCVRKNYTPVRYYISAWIVLAAGIFIFILRNVNILPNVFLTEFSMQIGSSLEAVLLAFGLAYRINVLQREKELAYEWSRLSQRKAEQLESDYRMLFETAPLGIALFDPEGRYLEMNLSYCLMYERTREELKGKDVFDMVFHEERRSVERSQWGGLVSRPAPGIVSFERTNITGSGKRINVRYFLNITKNEQGEPSGVLCCVEDVTDLKRALNKLTDSLKEKDILLKEVHHRVKNNLQIIISLFRIKSREIRDPKIEGILESTAGRIRAIANLHNRIYLSPDVAHVEADSFIRSTVKQALSVVHFSDDMLEVLYDITPSALGVDSALPLSLIINELVSNSAVHGWNGTDPLTISVGFHKEPSGDDKLPVRYTLTVRDNGKGFPEGFSLDMFDSFGLNLVETLTSQLEGELTLTGRPDTECKIVFRQKE